MVSACKTIVFYLLLIQMTRPSSFKILLQLEFLVDTFKVFSSFSRLKSNINKCEIYGLVILKGAQEAVCVLQNINLTKPVTQLKH